MAARVLLAASPIALLLTAASGGSGSLQRHKKLPACPLLGRVFGNSYCWGHGFDFHDCCGDSLPQDAPLSERGNPQCWDASRDLTFEACCFTADASWQADRHIQRASAILAPVVTGSSVEEWRASAATLFGASRCARVSLRKGLLQFSGSVRDDYARTQTLGRELGLGAARLEDCTERGGAPFGISIALGSPFLSRDLATFCLCADITCLPEEVASDVAPAYVLRNLTGIVREGDMIRKVIAMPLDEIKLQPPAGTPPRYGTFGRRVPPARTPDLSAYQRMFQVCGHCDLQLYGGPHAGGYLLCSLSAADSPGYLAVYSYGIQGDDSWGADVSRATGAVVHQYDCYNSTRPKCDPPCTAVFHDECLESEEDTQRDPRSTLRFGTLAAHLRENGHADAPRGSLLLKLDVEGAEWDVLRTIHDDDLRRFRQITAEFHRPYVMYRSDAECLDSRAAAMRKLLKFFFVVHVHACNYGDIDGYVGIEMTFANRDFYKPLDQCRWPTPHPLDTPSHPELPDLDIVRMFEAPRKALQEA
eukprot:TRINITY_DN2402_c0_g1_i1.p1 TRINITY_DN2402_c0_g1~~TRINITY_DN2402_c0_g1_i1.p1  ORF type:complete len:532 (-),score=95.77 TRINITY_DN2402_c0_g1_i1:280-1875(-)